MDRISSKSPNDYIMNHSIKGININLGHCSSVEKANPSFNSSSSRQEILNKTGKINEGFYILPANLHLPGWRVVNASLEELINNLQYHKYLGQLSPSEGVQPACSSSSSCKPHHWDGPGILWPHSSRFCFLTHKSPHLINHLPISGKKSTNCSMNLPVWTQNTKLLTVVTLP